jgi:hypothetical protein
MVVHFQSCKEKYLNYLKIQIIDEMIFVALEGASLNPGMEMEFTEDQLCNNFMLVVGR